METYTVTYRPVPTTRFQLDDICVNDNGVAFYMDPGTLDLIDKMPEMAHSIAKVRRTVKEADMELSPAYRFLPSEGATIQGVPHNGVIHVVCMHCGNLC